MFLRPEEKHITDKVIRILTLTGTKAELVERVRGLKQLGYDQLMFQATPGQENDMLQRWADVMAKV